MLGAVCLGVRGAGKDEENKTEGLKHYFLPQKR
ncbi:chemotaxis receptor (MCP) glutamine deamidase CheD [Bradyrhizobium sp. USDA 4523]|nr:chemotaxis receptor (MCP) glutamine deamidase CheD [Bradyrhizobium sp. USDA 4537]